MSKDELVGKSDDDAYAAAVSRSIRAAAKFASSDEQPRRADAMSDDSHTIILTPEAFAKFIEICENPPPPTQELIDLFKKYGSFAYPECGCAYSENDPRRAGAMSDGLAMIVFCTASFAIVCWAIACIGNILNWWNV